MDDINYYWDDVLEHMWKLEKEEQRKRERSAKVAKGLRFNRKARAFFEKRESVKYE